MKKIALLGEFEPDWEPHQVTNAAIELPDHPFFMGTLFVPQARSTLQNPHPLITECLRAVIG